MARTRASVGAKVASGKSSKARCSTPPPPPSRTNTGSSDRSSRSTGGNPVCPRETPKWQKPITNFFITMETNGDKKDTSDTEDKDTCTFFAAGNSKPKRNVIESDSEEEVETTKNQVLDETIELEPLNGEDSHKIEDYYPKNEDKKKSPEKSMEKENRKEKRDREDDEVQVRKRVKLCDN
ncbi:hypothetical protein K1T71_014758 [Dendrolimus kikuchii]|nr:hypothetical protein K1T71_014758 [Dendrolimus kikuchii]